MPYFRRKDAHSTYFYALNGKACKIQFNYFLLIFYNRDTIVTMLYSHTAESSTWIHHYPTNAVETTVEQLMSIDTIGFQ